MKQTNRFHLLFLLAIVLLLAGVINYWLCRPDILLFRWLGAIGVKRTITGKGGLTVFFRGYFSDITWCAALCLVTIAMDSRHHLSPAVKIVILLLPFATEIGQYFSVIPGSFDWWDIFCYIAIITCFHIIFPSILIPIPMNKIKPYLLGLGVFTVFFLMVLASAPPRRTTTYKKPYDPCVNHGALSYSPVLVQVNIDGSYTMKDLSGAQLSGQAYFFSALQATNYNKYELAQGVTPNLNIYITVNTDGYQHYGATVKFYVFDDNTWFNMPSNYVDPSKLFDDIASKLNQYISYGWTHGDCK